MNRDISTILLARGLTDADREMLTKLLKVWRDKLERNQLRMRYYEGKVTAAEVNIGIAVPEDLKNLQISCCWGAKAVDCLQERTQFDGFLFDGDEEDETLVRLVRENHLIAKYERAVTSELIHSCVFATVSAGFEGEPEAIVNFHSAETAAAIWDGRRNRIECGFAIMATRTRENSAEQEPSIVNLYTDDAITVIERGEGDEWTAERHANPLGRPLMEPMSYRPTDTRPFGRSRITRPAMTVIDCMLRTQLRAEIAAEFNTSPQKYILGADDDAFEKDAWESYIGNWLLVSKDDDGDVPQVGQLSAGSMQPHNEYARVLAEQFSALTDLPVSELGVIHDNPASAESIYASRESLVIAATQLNRTNGIALENIAQMLVAVAEGVSLDEVPESVKTATAHFKNPALPSLVSQADAVIKISSAAPWFGDTEMFLACLGFDRPERAKLLSDKRKSMGRAMVMQQDAAAHEATMYEISSIIKDFRSGIIQRKDAYVLFGQIGIDRDEADDMLNGEVPSQVVGNGVD